jgi:hypothetical protein
MSTTQRTYSIAFQAESGDFDEVERFRAVDDDEANAYAEEHYPNQEWYVLDSDGDNINA